MKIKLVKSQKNAIKRAFKIGYLDFEKIPELSALVTPQWIGWYRLLGQDPKELFQIPIETRELKISLLEALTTGVWEIPAATYKELEEKFEKNPFIEVLKQWDE